MACAFMGILRVLCTVSSYTIIAACYCLAQRCQTGRFCSQFKSFLVNKENHSTLGSFHLLWYLSTVQYIDALKGTSVFSLSPTFVRYSLFLFNRQVSTFTLGNTQNWTNSKWHWTTKANVSHTVWAIWTPLAHSGQAKGVWLHLCKLQPTIVS